MKFNEFDEKTKKKRKGKEDVTMRLRKLLFTLMVAVAAVVGVNAEAFALTASGTQVDNRASVVYSVPSVPGTFTIESSPTGNTTVGAGSGSNTTFLVDTKVDFTVAASPAAYVYVAPSTTAQVLRYTVTNNSNETLDFDLAQIQTSITDPYGGSDNFDASSVNIYVDGDADGVYDGGAPDTATFINALAGNGGSIYVFVVANIGVQVNGDIAAVALKAIAHKSTSAALDAIVAESGLADNAAVVEYVYAEGDGDNGEWDDTAEDGEHVARHAYKVGAAALTVTKTATVISDGYSPAGQEKPIPGAVVRYTLTIANGATGATATSVTISDSLNTEIGSGAIAFNTQHTGCLAGEGVKVDGTCKTNANDAEAGADADWNVTGTNTVTVTGLSIPASTTVTVTFEVTVQ